MARPMSVAQMKELLEQHMNDYDSEEIEVSYNTVDKLVEDHGEFNEVYMSKSTRMLLQALEALESTGGLDFAVLKYPDLGDIWSRYTRRREEKRLRAQAVEKLKSTFSREEMQLLGITNLVK
jgi:hypothetical protein